MDEYIERETALREAKYAAVRGLDPVAFVEDVPVADVVPVVHARWVKDNDGDWTCTNCQEAVVICESGKDRTYRKPYCPNCGAKMDGGDGQA